MSTQYDNLIQGAATQAGVDPGTMLAIYQQENGPGNPTVVSSSGAVGLMQIEPSTALTIDPSLGTKANAAQQLTDPSYNAQIGAQYLAGLQNGKYLPAGSDPVTNSGDLAAAYYSGGVYKDSNGNYTTRSGAPGGPPTVQQYASQVNTRIAGGGSTIAGAASGSQGLVSPHAIPDQAGLYKGIEGLNTETLPNFNVPSPFLAYVQVTIGGGEIPGQSQDDANNNSGSTQSLTQFNPDGTVPSTTSSSGITTFSVGTVIKNPTPPPPPKSQAVIISPDLTSNPRHIRVTDFSYEEGMGIGSGRFVVKLYLETERDLNILAVLVAKYKQINITWGYQQAQGTLVRSLDGAVRHFNHQFAATGFYVTIEGQDVAAGGQNNIGAYSYSPVTGKISDVASYIAAQHGWDTAIEETIALYDGDDPHKGPRVYTRTGAESEMGFLKRLAKSAKSAIRAYDGSAPAGHYEAFFAQGKLHFHSVQVATTEGTAVPVRTYIWGGLGNDPRASVVRDFVMNYYGSALLHLGVGQLKSLSTDPTTGQVRTIATVGQRITDYPLQTTHRTGSQDSVRTTGLSAKTSDEAEAKTVQRFLELRDDVFTADLTIIGDPFLNCGDIIHVVVQRAGYNPQIFYNWNVKHITHTLAGGEYIMRCSLFINSTSSLMDGIFSVNADQASISDFANGPATNPLEAPPQQ